MKTLRSLIQSLIALHEQGTHITLLAVCPNSTAVLEAAIKATASNNTPMLFAATLNQVDLDGSYTGWTQKAFVKTMHDFAAKYGWNGPLYPCLDHGGPWLKDIHTLQGLSLRETMQAVKESLTASLEAGYHLLHIDPTVDRTLSPGTPLSIDTVIARTVELIAHAEAERKRLGLPPVDYEVGTEEVHGGLVDLDSFKHFVIGLREALAAGDLSDAWPCFIVAKVGTDLHTTFFDPETAQQLYDLVAPFGSLIKGHYTDWVRNPEAYPASGMGGANLGPEFTKEEYMALADLSAKEESLCRYRPSVEPSDFMEVLKDTVVASKRWQKWRLPNEQGLAFAQIAPERQVWMVQTGARYCWTQPPVVAARRKLYDNLRPILRDPHQVVVDRIARVIDSYITSFGLFDALTIL